MTFLKKSCIFILDFGYERDITRTLSFPAKSILPKTNYRIYSHDTMNVTNTLKTRLSLLFLFLTSTFFTSLIAQIEFGGQPFSLQQDHAARFKEDVSIIQIKNLNMDLIKKEDEALVGTVRFAAPMVVDMDIYEDGFATVLENGDVVYRLKVQASNALGLYFLYDNFRIPHGGQ